LETLSSISVTLYLLLKLTFVVNVNQIYGLQLKCFCYKDELLSRIQQLFGILCTFTTYITIKQTFLHYVY